MAKHREKQLAYEYYIKGLLTQREIAKIIGISEKTLVEWIQEGKWEENRNKLQLSKAQLAELTYQTSILFMKQLAEKEKVQIADIDAITKIAAAIDKIVGKSSAPNVIEIMMDFLKFVEKYGPNHAKILSELAQNYIQTKI